MRFEDFGSVRIASELGMTRDERYQEPNHQCDVGDRNGDPSVRSEHAS